jgi:hypothetical protein
MTFTNTVFLIFISLGGAPALNKQGRFPGGLPEAANSKTRILPECGLKTERLFSFYMTIAKFAGISYTLE